jgi:hypothetical protein
MICPSLKCLCGEFLWLPYPRFQGTEASRSTWSPPKEILLREIACLSCGRVTSYTARDVRWEQFPPHEDQTPGSGDVVCWCIEAECDEVLCDLTIEFHILARAQRGAEEIRFSMLRLFERNFFQGLLCGRGHPPSKTRVRAVRRVGQP